MTPAAIHSSRRRRNVVAEQRRSPWRRYPAPKTRTLISISKTIRSEIRGRWQPNGCRSWRAGKRAANCSQMGSIRHDGKAGTGCSSSSNCQKSFDDQAARAAYVGGAPNPVTARLLAHSLSDFIAQNNLIIGPLSRLGGRREELMPAYAIAWTQRAVRVRFGASVVRLDSFGSATPPG